MKLSAAFLSDQLSSLFSLKRPRRLSPEASLEYPTVLPEKGPLENHRVYLCDAEHLETFLSDPLPDRCFFLVSGTPVREPDVDYALLPAGTDLFRVCLEVQEIFRRYGQWQEDMMRARLEGHSIQYLLNASMEVFHNSLALVSMDFSVLASAPPAQILSRIHCFSLSRPHGFTWTIFAAVTFTRR